MARHILVVVDSRDSLATVNHALELAGREGAEVTVLGLESPAPSGMATPTVPDGATARRRADLAAAIREARRRGASAGQEIGVVVRRGSPMDTVVNAALEREVNLIVVEAGLPWLGRRARKRGVTRLERASRRTVVAVNTPARSPGQVAAPSAA